MKTTKTGMATAGQRVDESTRTNAILIAIAVAIAICWMGTPASAQDDKQRLVIESKSVTTKDGWPIHFDYYKKNEGRETPVVVLLHNKGSDALVWKNAFGNDLWDNGYAVIAVDLRKHGQSKGNAQDVSDLRPNDYVAMVTQDMMAIKGFIFDEHQAGRLNMRKMAIVAPEMSAPVALNFAEIDWNARPYDDSPVPAARTPRGQDVRAIVLLSPEESLPRVNTTKVLRSLANPAKQVAFLIGVGTKDSLDKGASKKMYQIVSGNARNKDRTYLQTYPYNMRGTDLVSRVPKVKGHILAFFDKHLKELNSPWVDRRSRLLR